MSNKPKPPELTPLLYKDKTIAKLLDVSRVTIWRWVRKEIFPKPFKIGASTFWKAEDVNKFIADNTNQD